MKWLNYYHFIKPNLLLLQNCRKNVLDVTKLKIMVSVCRLYIKENNFRYTYYIDAFVVKE